MGVGVGMCTVCVFWECRLFLNNGVCLGRRSEKFALSTESAFVRKHTNPRVSLH